jgi:hypothetical protein
VNDLGHTFTIVLKALSSLSDGDVGMAFLSLAAAGTIAMAALQVVKEVTPYRRKVQYQWFTSWQDERAADVEKCAADEALKALLRDFPVCASKTRPELVELSAGRAENALFSMSTDDMVAQMKLAIPIVIDEANRYPSTLLTLSFGASSPDLAMILKGQPQNGSPQLYFDARARVTRRMERTLDGICIALADRWRLRMQMISLATTTAIVLAVVIAQDAGLGAILLAVPIGIVGGYFAPITRDLVAALQKLR